MNNFFLKKSCSKRNFLQLPLCQNSFQACIPPPLSLGLVFLYLKDFNVDCGGFKFLRLTSSLGQLLVNVTSAPVEEILQDFGFFSKSPTGPFGVPSPWSHVFFFPTDHRDLIRAMKGAISA